MTSAALSPTGAFKQASDCFIVLTASSGIAFPVSLSVESPACNFLLKILNQDYH